MKFLKLKAMFIMLAIFGLALNSCEETIDPIDGDAPAPATALAANSKSVTEVMLKWDASPSAADDAIEYDVIVTPPGVDPVTVATVTMDDLPYTVTDLTEGTIYTFEIKAKYEGMTNLSEAIALEWSPATRFVDNINGETIVIYESASSFGSGLDLFDNDGEAPKSLKVASISSWNMGLYTTDGTITFGSASELSYTGAGTAQGVEISSNYYDNVDNLNDIFASEALNNGTFAPMTLDLSAEMFSGKKNLVFIVRTQEPGQAGKYNYAKVMVIPSAAGFLHGDSPNRYLEFQVSYQKTAGVPYAKD